MRIRRPRRAVTLIEAVLFIAVALGLIIGGLVFYQQARTASQVRDAMQLSQSIAAEIRAMNLGPGESMSQNDTKLYLAAAGSIPSDRIDSGGSSVATLPWENGSLSVSINTDDWVFMTTPDFEYFIFTYLNVPSHICTRLIVSDANGLSGLGPGLVSVKQTTAGALQIDVDPDGISPADASAFCHNHVGNKDFHVIFRLY